MTNHFKCGHLRTGIADEAAQGGGTVTQNSVTGGADPVVTALEGRLRSHKERFTLFAFMEEHVIPNETYRLTENDLTRLEIVSRYS